MSKKKSSSAAESDSLILHIASTKTDMALQVGQFVRDRAKLAIHERGRFTIAFSGGSLPAIVAHGLLASAAAQAEDDSKAEQEAAQKREAQFYSKWHVFFADERYVPLDDKDSNYKACVDVLFSKLGGGSGKYGVPADQIYAIDPTLELPEAARAYEQLVRKHVKPARVAGVPAFDLVLLGMGPDGHTCSLFPGHKILREMHSLVAPIDDSPKPPSKRVTMTYPLLDAARCAAFVAAGAAKQSALVSVLASASNDGMSSAAANQRHGHIRMGSNGKDDRLPAARISSSQVHWFIDEAAAAKLHQ